MSEKYYVSQEAFDEAAELLRNVVTLEFQLSDSSNSMKERRVIKDQISIMLGKRYELLGNKINVAPFTEWEEAGAKAIYDLNNPQKNGDRGQAWKMYIPSARAAIHARLS